MAKKATTGTNGLGNEAVTRLQSIVQRIERMEEEKKAAADDIKDIYVEAKSAGFDSKVIKQMIKERKQEREALADYLSVCDVYRDALRAATAGTGL
jgi:uncharacterized protein (UPF0335 family)